MPTIRSVFAAMSGAAALVTLMSGCRDLPTAPRPSAPRTPLQSTAAPGSFAATGQMSTPRAFHSATLLANGKVLIAGGVSGLAQGATLTTAELYDPASATFTLTGSMAAPRAGHTATLLPNATVLLVGGNNQSGILATAELYDPATGTFSFTGSLTTARTGHTATLLKSGQVLVIGGAGPAGILASAEIYK